MTIKVLRESTGFLLPIKKFRKNKIRKTIVVGIKGKKNKDQEDVFASPTRKKKKPSDIQTRSHKPFFSFFLSFSNLVSLRA